MSDEILAKPLREFDWIPAQRMRQLERFGLNTVEDLLTHYPRRYEDRTRFDHFPQQESDTPVCVCGIVAKTAVKRLPGWKKLFEVVLREEESHALSGTLHCRWFNAHFIEKMIATGQRLVVFGKPKLRKNTICIDHPDFEIVENDDDISIHLKRIAPIYRSTEGLSQRVLRSAIFHLLEWIGKTEMESRLPAGLDSMRLGKALQQIHFPDSSESLDKARRHLVLCEFFAMQLFIGAKRAETMSRPGASHCGAGALLEEFRQRLQFSFTKAQQRCVAEIRADLVAPRPMNRLLHGDVGSGKTVVALSAMLLAVEAGWQAALMAPTQILAEQHYLNFKRWLEPLGVSVALRTGARQEDTTTLPLFDKATTRKSGAEITQDADVPVPGSTGVPPVGDGVSPSRTSADMHYTKRSLPHFEHPWAIYAVTICTRSRRCLSPHARSIVLDALTHFHNVRYELIAACVMPDHVHFLFQPLPKGNDGAGNVVFWPLSELLHSVKSFSSHAINKEDGKRGTVWEEERFDRYIRSDRDLEEKFQYIVRNPWECGVARPNEHYAWVWTREDEFRVRSEATPLESSLRRDASTNRRDACATQTIASTRHAVFDSGEPAITIGTHALLYEGNVNFSKLGLIVIDEQHKFGVMQRARLIEQGTAPDVLVMTATPIPRTLTMTLYGDLDVSTLDEMPANRGKIVTAARDASKLPDIVAFIRKQLDAGRQAYIVYPLIDESAKLEAKAAAGEFEKWKSLLAPMRCDLLHGRIDAAEKDEIMERFRRGETKVLIATSVIEVGIDVPNANIMLIENAERFGLAQLHQLRGRIGRGAHKSYCILISSAKNEEAMEKLQTLEKTADGFEIAETDLRLRGPGDILGTAQSGLPPLKLGDPLADTGLMQLARKAAIEIFASDPKLESSENKRFRDLILERRKLMLSQVS